MALKRWNIIWKLFLSNISLVTPFEISKINLLCLVFIIKILTKFFNQIISLYFIKYKGHNVVYLQHNTLNNY